jgi:hypothetical protein
MYVNYNYNKMKIQLPATPRKWTARLDYDSLDH